MTAQVAGPPPAQAGPAPFLELELGRSTAASGVVLRVFLGEPAADARTPSTSPGYVGSLSLFGTDAAGGGQRFVLPLKDAVAQLERTGRHDPLGGTEAEVTVALAPIREDAAAVAAAAEVEVEAATIYWR